MKMVSLAGHCSARYRCGVAFALAVLILVLPACRRHAATGSEPGRGQTTFASPAEAGKALAEAASNDNQDQMLAIFGPNSKDVIYSGNPEEDKTSLAQFASAYNRMNRWRQIDNGSQILLVGVSNTTFPIPLKKDSSGKWFFDTAAGKKELKNREIGRNELAVIDICAGLVDAQVEYFNQAHDGQKQYAAQFISDPGKENGLYWPPEAGKPKSPVGPLLAYATEQGAKLNPSLHLPFHGYYFGILKSQGYWANGGLKDYARGGIMNRGFAFIAWPEKYGVTGFNTFIIDADRVVFQRDLGENTAEQAPFMPQFNPASEWAEVKE
jgi:hypothetical protein